MAIEIVQAPPAHMLQHPTEPSIYLFAPQADGEVVAVTHRTKKYHGVYRPSTAEARRLWQRLLKKGYERV